MKLDGCHSCDGATCTAHTCDRIKDGWIVVGDGGFTKYKGRDKDGAGVTEIFVRDGSDFCSWRCLESRTGRRP